MQKLLLLTFCLSLQFLRAPAASAQSTDNMIIAQANKTLHGEISDTGVFSEELQSKLGIGVVRVKGRLTVGLVVEGKGAAGGLREGDVILDSRVENGVLTAKIERGGKTSTLSITVDDSVQNGTAPAAVSGGAPFKKYAGILAYNSSFTLHGEESLLNYAGWTHEAFEDARAWSAEYDGGTGEGPLLGPWSKTISNAQKLAQGYMDKYWPSTLIGWRSYHLTVDHNGRIIAIFRYPDSAAHWASNDEEFERYARGCMDGLSKSGVLAPPPQSRLKRWQTGIDFEIFHDPKLRY